MRLQSFIFNWPGQSENVNKIYNDIDGSVVINSGDTDIVDRCHNIGDHSYFSAQFKKMLSLHDGTSTILHIQGDARYYDWSKLIKDAGHYMSRYSAGIYYPVVKNTSWTADKMAVTKLSSQDDNIRYVADGDETVWFIHPDVINYFNDHNLIEILHDNKYGFGWDLILCSICHLKQIPVIRDNNHIIEHPRSKGYDFHEAWIEFKDVMNQLPGDLKIIAEMVHNNHKIDDLKNHVDKYCI